MKEALSEKILHLCESSCNKFCHYTKISRKSLGIYIRSFHLSAPYGLLFLYWISSHYIVIMINFLLLLALLAFYSFNGCLLTRLELKLCNDDFTFIDPLIEMLGLEKSPKTRYTVSLKVAFIYLFTVFVIYSYRFLL